MINPDELLFSVDEQNRPIAPQPRKLSHQTGIWHRACHIWIVNTKEQILCQQRSLLKDSNPGLWEPFFGGHLAPKQEYIDSAMAELKEELGIQLQPQDLQFFKEHRYVPGTEYQGIFILKQDIETADLQLEEDEVQQVTWKSIGEVKREIVGTRNKQWTIIGYETGILDFLEK